jgi:hypothetical protein
VSTEGVTLKSTYLYDGQDFTTDQWICCVNPPKIDLLYPTHPRNKMHIEYEMGGFELV